MCNTPELKVPKLEKIVELSCNLDDMTGEAIGFALETLLANGARDAFTIPIQMKKSRPGVLLSVICMPEDADRLAALIFRHTTTLGVRKNVMERYALERRMETVETNFGPVRAKISTGFGTEKRKLEYDDLAKHARENNVPLSEIQPLK